MSLKLIPLEPAEKNQEAKKQKNFNPGHRIKKNSAPSGNEKSSNSTLKNICLRLIHFINRGSRFTYQQIDELIMAMERSILSLRKKKQEMMKKGRR